ncbi:MAG: flagellar basal body rod protein FlgB [Rhodospirillales bacterium]|jgi:flagellar basal-body rod protein FlgB|nr:flagellar basal body rod protein FlgB [Rhodospirillales bacterium]
MDFNNMTLFNTVKKRLNWVTQRQEVLAQNVANADTPDFRARDLKPYEFKEMLRSESMQINMDATNGGHLGGHRKRITDFYEDKQAFSYETSPDGNSVILEEQMQKLNETQISHRFTTEIYNKHLRMLRTALGK